MGFGPKWLGWTHAWFRYAKIQITLIGDGGKEIKCSRGLRQGDPLSPLLFTLVADGLDKPFNKAKEEKLIEGLNASRKIKITNLQYADDTILFGQPDIEQTIIIKWILKTFEI